MAGLKGLAWNCGGLRTNTANSRKKALYFEKEHKNNFDIAFFLETHHKNANEMPPEMLRYDNTHHIIHSTANDNDTYGGIIGLLSKDYDIIDTKHLIRGRILNVKIQHNENKTVHNVSAVYLYTNNNLTKDKMKIIATELRRENQDHPNNIILGDFNFIDHEKDKLNGLNRTDKAACQIWQPLLAEIDMVDPYREQNPKRRIWSFIGSGKAGNSRIDRIYVNSINMKNITNIQYIQTPFGGHRILSFIKKSENKKGKGYYKMNTSILKDPKYKEMVKETVKELEDLQIVDKIRRWQTFLQTIKSKSIHYSQIKNKVKNKLKEELMKTINEIEENPLNLEEMSISARYEYTKQKLKEREEIEIEGYKIRVKHLASYEKVEPDIAFYSKLEKKHIANGTIGQMAENKESKIYTDNENIMKIATKYYSDLYTPSKVNTKSQERLLRNVKKQISKEQKQKLEATILMDELKASVFQMKPGSPGLDGISIEFYQEYWDEIKDYYFEFINKVKIEAFSKSKNTSVIKLI